MSRFVARIQALALTLGAPGPLPRHLPRLVVLVAPGDRGPDGRLDGHPAQVAAPALRGSGHARVARRLPRAVLRRQEGRRRARAQALRIGTRIERALATLQRYGVLAVLIPSLLPPPAPFKIFILLAGVVEIPVARVLDRAPARPRRAVLRSRGCWRSGTASRRSPTSARTPPPPRSAAVGVVLAAVAVYALWSRARGRAGR